MSSMIGTLLLLVLAASLAFAQSPDIVLKTRTRFFFQTSAGVQPGRERTFTLYVQGDRQRREEQFEAFGPAPASSHATIYRPDIKQIIHLNSVARTYFIAEFDPEQQEKRTRQLMQDANSGNASPMTQAAEAGVLTITVDTTDTGERREINGFTLRHLRRVVTQVPSGGAPESLGQRIERDGWYLDTPAPGATGTQPRPDALLLSFAVAPGQQRPRLDFKRIGNAKARLGQAVSETVTSTSEKSESKEVTELVELASLPIDPAKFEIPGEYRPAQRLSHGGVDMQNPATLWGDLRTWWRDLWSR